MCDGCLSGWCLCDEDGERDDSVKMSLWVRRLWSWIDRIIAENAAEEKSRRSRM